jgi:hypothetical protein
LATNVCVPAFKVDCSANVQLPLPSATVVPAVPSTYTVMFALVLEVPTTVLGEVPNSAPLAGAEMTGAASVQFSLVHVPPPGHVELPVKHCTQVCWVVSQNAAAGLPEQSPPPKHPSVNVTLVVALVICAGLAPSVATTLAEYEP